MTDPFDLFCLETSGPRWLESVATVEHAKARVRELAVRWPSEYLVLDHKTGNKLIIKLDDVEKQSTNMTRMPGTLIACQQQKEG